MQSAADAENTADNTADNTVENTAENIAENISILHLLHKVVVLPKSNPVPALIGHHETEYSLSFEKERNLTIMLAYISCIKDNPNRIPALCISENKAETRLDILCAVNASNAAEKGALHDIQKNFQSLFALLPSAPTCKTVPVGVVLQSLIPFPTDMQFPFWSAENAEQGILSEIVSMCTTRIRERLRLVLPKEKRTKKPLMETHIRKSIRSLAQKSPEFVDAAEDWVEKINQLGENPTTSELTQVVESADRLSRLPDLESFLDGIPNREMDPKSRKSLLDTIKKVGRYRNAARVLYRAAKKFPIARRMKFVPVNLSEAEFEKVPKTMQAPGRGILEALSRTTLSESEREEMNSCYDCLETDQEAVDKLFRDQKMETLDRAKIHAEVQLVFFCEKSNFQPPPRVISSSKDACFLCNALIKVHGKYHIPRQHGRLYPGWRLPWFPEPNSIQNRFAKHLEEVISGSIRKMIRSQTRINYSPPNESTTLTVTMSETTASANGDCHPAPSRSSSPAKLEVPQPAPRHDPGEVGASAVHLPIPGSTSLSIANGAKAQGEMASQPQEFVHQGEHGEEENSVLLGKPEEDQGENGQMDDSVLPKKPEEVADQGEHRDNRDSVLPGKSEEVADQGTHGEKGNSVPPGKPGEVIDQGEQGETQNSVLSQKPEEVADQGELGETQDSVLPEKPEEAADQGEYREQGDSVLPEKAEEVTDQGKHEENGNSVLPGEPEEVAHQGGEKGKLMSSEKPPEVGDDGGEEGKAVVPPGKPPKVPPRPPPKPRKEPPRVFSERWANLSRPAPNRLTQGTSQVVNVEANTTSRFYKGSSVGLEIEYSTTGPAEKRVARDLSCNLEWLAPADAEAVRADRDALVINVEKLEDEIPIPSSALGRWYIATKKMMIRVQIR